MSFQTVSRILEGRNPLTEASNFNDCGIVKKIAWSVRVASSYVPAATCLTQALTTVKLLTKFRQPANFRIGVAKNEEGKLEAHAWVESCGLIVTGDLPDLSRYTVLSPLSEVYQHERDLRHIAS
jgi:hypothetical protein